MPAMSELHTPPAIQASVVALWSQGISKRQIARDLKIDKNTVMAILKAFRQDKPDSDSQIEQITPLAYTAVKTALSKGDGRIGMDWLKQTVFSQPSGNNYTINADQVLLSGIGLLPSTNRPESTESTESARVIDALPAPPTEAPAKPAPSDISLSSHPNFSKNEAPALSQFDTADLLRELQRRGEI
jgi:Homeodomain-like domain